MATPRSLIRLLRFTSPPCPSAIFPNSLWRSFPAHAGLMEDEPGISATCGRPSEISDIGVLKIHLHHISDIALWLSGHGRGGAGSPQNGIIQGGFKTTCPHRRIGIPHVNRRIDIALRVQNGGIRGPEITCPQAGLPYGDALSEDR